MNSTVSKKQEEKWSQQSNWKCGQNLTRKSQSRFEKRCGLRPLPQKQNISSEKWCKLNHVECNYLWASESLNSMNERYYQSNSSGYCRLTSTYSKFVSTNSRVMILADSLFPLDSYTRQASSSGKRGLFCLQFFHSTLLAVLLFRSVKQRKIEEPSGNLTRNHVDYHSLFLYCSRLSYAQPAHANMSSQIPSPLPTDI